MKLFLNRYEFIGTIYMKEHSRGHSLNNKNICDKMGNFPIELKLYFGKFFIFFK